MESSNQLNVMNRWLIRRDMPEVLEIERDSFEFPWSEEDFLCCLRQRNCIGMVADTDQQVVGFMIYELFKKRLSILNFAVHPGHRHRHVGTQMVTTLIDKLTMQRRREITLLIRETNLSGQLFFKSMGFLAVNTVRHYYDETDEDAYFMRYRIGETHRPIASHTQNRLTEYFECQ